MRPDTNYRLTLLVAPVENTMVDWYGCLLWLVAVVDNARLIICLVALLELGLGLIALNSTTIV